MRPQDEALAQRLRGLPAIERLLGSDAAAELIASSSRPALTEALRRTLADTRAAMRRDASRTAPDAETLVAQASVRMRAETRPARQRVINATGIVLHTNLGRAPLAGEAIRAAVEASGYVDLEFDLETGTRGSRLGGIEAALRAVTGAEAAVVVNNCAAAVLLALSAHAAAGEVVVSRGELIEIGGGFRVPDIIAQGGARLLEVGTTNRTRLSDYASAIGPQTRMLLKVHRSNFRMSGFVGEVSAAELAGLGRERGLVSMIDLGSGTIADLARLTPGGALREPTVGEQVAACDLVAFSCDKLLGGPQAGIVAGTEAAVAPLRRHPLARAMRLDKMTLAALEATLRLYERAETARIPVLRMLAQTATMLEARAERLCELLAGPASATLSAIAAAVEESGAEAGGGTLPGERLESRAVSLSVGRMSADALARALRLSSPPVVGRVAEGRVLLDLFAVGDDELAMIAAGVQRIASGQ